MSPTRVIYRGSLALLALLLAVRAPLSGCEKDEEEVKVSVVAILATDRDDKVDPKLECIAKEVKKKDPKLTGVRQGVMTCKPVKVGSKEKFDLVEDQVVCVTIDHAADKNNRVQLKIKAPMLGEITYDTCCGKFLPVMTPYKTKDGDVLFIAIRVQPCHGK
jgi:hypothetical protein